MAQDNVVMDRLTPEMIDVGDELTRKLDELGLTPTAAFWFFMTDLNEWRLLFASPEVRKQGPRAVYVKIHEAIEQLGEKSATIPLSAVVVLDEEAELVRLLHGVVNTGRAIGRVRFSKNVINGHFIDDALIYRVA
jgi:hypothetical protein